ADGAVVEEALEVVGEVAGSGVAVGGAPGDGLEDDRLQLRRDGGVEPAGGGRLVESEAAQHLLAVGSVEEGVEGEQLVGGGAARRKRSLPCPVCWADRAARVEATPDRLGVGAARLAAPASPVRLGSPDLLARSSARSDDRDRPSMNCMA